MADETARRTPTPAKLLLGLILAVIVVAVVWLAYATLTQTAGDPDSGAAPTAIERQADSPSNPERAGGTPPGE